MADYLVKEESLISIADAIREKTGEIAELAFPEDYIIKINDLASSSSEEIPSNGKDWVQSNISNITFNDIHGNGTLWIACSDNGLYYSEDGKTWSQTNITNGVFYRTNYANGTWVASGEENLYYSTDGINWNSSNYYSSTTSDQNIEYHNGYWGYLNYDMSEFYFSSDGISWETEGGAYPSTVYYNEDLGKWVGFEYVSTFRTNVYTSPHGGGWTSEGTIMGSDVIDFNIFYNANGMTIASSSISYTDSALWYSTDGLNFEQGTLPIGIIINKIFYANGLWVALTGNDEGIFYSTDGITWTQSPMNTGSFTSIYYENFMWIAGSTEGIYYSTDGINWTQSTGITSSVEDVYCDSSIWVAATDSTGLYYSDSWTDSMKETYDSIPNGDEVSY